MPKVKLGDVFKTVGLPPYTYVKPAYFGEIRSDIEQAGRHLLIEGPSGVGKTCVAFKVFQELGWANNVNFEYLSCRDEGAAERIEAFIANMSRDGDLDVPVLVVDDLHILEPSVRKELGSSLKRLSDRVFERDSPPKLVLIGIPTAGGSLLADAYDLGPRLGLYRFERARNEEIDRLISDGEEALNVLFEDRDVILSESNGNFWMAQYICNKICASQDVHDSQDDAKILNFDLISIRKRLMVELSTRYMPTARTFAKGKKWRPGGNKPYLEILLAIMKIPDLVIPFDRVLSVVPDRRKPGIKAVRTRISEVICDRTKGVDLRRQMAFELESGFSIEDPMYRYFLTNISPEDIYRELGVAPEAFESSKVWSYDVGFSFAGETRRLVEAVNEELKKEDVVTFYDFDQQSLLLAADLEEAFRRVYAESCRYYIVFVDKNYMDKDWTRFERDVMTRSNRVRHIIPVITDDAAKAGVFGISGVIGRVDLSSQWKEICETGRITEEIRNAIRNRLVLPVTEKIDSSFDEV